MRKNNEFFVYTCMWLAAVTVLMLLLMQSLGDARIVNYSGIVRGATQKLVKEELNGQQDNALIRTLDGIIRNLQTGKGEFNLRKNSDRDYQAQLTRLSQIWDRIKAEIYQVRHGQSAQDALFELSQEHFQVADQMVLLAEQSSEQKLKRFIAIYGGVLLISICIFTMLNIRSRKALENSIYTDHLTGLLNRAGFKEEAAALLRQRDGGRYCLLEVDIDDFKFFNNSYGFEQGDALLRAVAEGLQSAYHTGQLCARVAADDFVLLAKQDAGLAEDLRRQLTIALQREPLINVSEFVTFTIGAYEIPESGEPVQAVMDKANLAHKHAKSLGKSLTAWYDDTLLDKLNQENRLKNQLRRALDGGEFKLYLQPKLTLSTLELSGAEALVRWDNPELGLVMPDQFIPIFERNGTIAEIDFYMLEQACAFIRQHIEEQGKELSIAVNFSRVTIYQQRFFPTVIDLVDRYRIPYHCIEIEVTESAFHEVSDLMVKKLLLLKDEGFVISMDDFGSGYSSLNLLDKLPIQVLKLDREFLREYSESSRVRHVIRCVTELAQALDIKVVCEGIEEKEHVSFLQQLGCDYGQGYYFSRPIPQEEFRAKYACRAV